MKDRCVVCNKETLYETETHINNRYNYVEGVGQVCNACYEKSNILNYSTFTYNKKLLDIQEEENFSICIDSSVIKSMPNNESLGEKVRDIYFKRKYLK